MEKKYIALAIAIVLLAGGTYVSERWFVTPPKVKPWVDRSSYALQKNILGQTVSTKDFNTVSFAAAKSGTVLEIMRALADSGRLTFSGRDFPGLGFFVEEINDKRNANGLYWFLYINGTSSEKGASSAVVGPGDVVEWRYQASH